MEDVLRHNWLRETVEDQAQLTDSSSIMAHPVVMTRIGKLGFGLDEAAVMGALKNKTFNHFTTCYHLVRLNADKSAR
jgi:hypothetical protein